MVVVLPSVHKIDLSSALKRIRSQRPFAVVVLWYRCDPPLCVWEKLPYCIAQTPGEKVNVGSAFNVLPRLSRRPQMRS